jgi:oxygen-dependent protoporphyrinogen oxidase
VWRVEYAAGADEADGVVVATSAAAASRILELAFAAPARALAGAATLSSVTVSLAYARSAVGHPLDGTGFVVVESAQDEGFRACTFASSKLPGRAPADRVFLRVFFRPSESDHGLSDAEWSARAERSLGRALRLRTSFERSWVSRWRDALPVFDDAHRERVAALEAALRGRGVVLAGSAFHGSGIDAAVKSAEQASKALAGSSR